MADAQGPGDSEVAEKMPCCAGCKKEATKEKPMKHCAKCKTKYCSRECQVADWKKHKLDCPILRKAFDPTSSTISKGLSAPFAKPFHALNDKKYLHGRPEKDVYQILIDCYRLRVEDDYKLSGDVDDDSIYGGAPNGYAGFRRFLNQAKKCKGLLPEWWSEEKAKDCLRLGQGSGWPNLNCAVEKSDVIEHYDNGLMPMQLRILGEQVLGEASWARWGGGSATMMAGQMLKEKGEIGAVILDMSSMTLR